MAILQNLMMLLMKPVIKEITSDLTAFFTEEITNLKNELIDAHMRSKKFDEAQKYGNELKDELLQANSDAELRAILRKTSNYLDSITKL